jgi:hypothetical protein
MDQAVAPIKYLAAYWFKLSRSSPLLAYSYHCNLAMEAFSTFMYGRELACISNVLHVLHMKIANIL